MKNRKVQRQIHSQKNDMNSSLGTCLKAQIGYYTLVEVLGGEGGH